MQLGPERERPKKEHSKRPRVERQQDSLGSILESHRVSLELQPRFKGLHKSVNKGGMAPGWEQLWRRGKKTVCVFPDITQCALHTLFHSQKT